MAPRTANPFDQWLWQLDDEMLGELRLPALQRAATEAGVSFPQMTLLTVIGDRDDPGELLYERARGIDAIRFTDHVRLARARTGSTSYVIAIWPVAEKVFHLAGTVPATDDAWARVQKAWMNAAAPHLSPVILNRADFGDIGDALAEHGNIETARMTARVLRDSSSYSRGWPSIPGRARPTHREALGETAGMSVHSLMLDVGGRTRLQMRRSSGASFYRGDFEVFSSVVLQRLSRAAVDRRGLLGEQRRVPQAGASSVLAMSIDELDLDDPRVRDRLRSAIAKVRGLQLAVVHDNPYVHLLVTDILNGSSFDVLVTDAGRIEILPGFEPSVGSLARVTDALGEALGMKELYEVDLGAKIPEREFFGA